MGYVNEKISQEDRLKYDLATIDKRLPFGSPARDWAIDRERESWVRLYRQLTDKDDGTEIRTYWDFYWKGSLVLVETIALKRFRSDDGVYYGYIRVLRLDVPDNALPNKSEILQEFKAALEAHFIGIGIRVGGKTKSCKVDLEYEGEVI
ncbi:MAG: hypothetical protein LBE89_00990 [Helicobacteraceae bacterium]|jgi:hypothetical protein|nr:hypothetical protein [Helicobacteraceae bacterium]